MALYFIGIGLHGAKGIPIIGLELAKKCERVYLDAYTSPLGPEDLEALQTMIGRVNVVGREFVEDGRKIIEEAKQGDIALLSIGDPMVATTHTELRVRAERAGVKAQVIHSSSILSALPGEAGLLTYNFGKPVTLTKALTSRTTVYEVVYENLAHGLHTIILLEYDQTNGSFVAPNDALKALLDAEGDLKRGLFDAETFLVVASRLCSASQSVVGGGLGSLLEKDFGPPPHALVVPSRLHFVEVEALKTLCGVAEDDIADNSSRAQRLAKAMVEGYVKNTKKALLKAKKKSEEEGKGHLASLLENVECYLSDASRFLGQGKYELALLSVGYAEGLLDSLRFTGELKVEW